MGCIDKADDKSPTVHLHKSVITRPNFIALIRRRTASNLEIDCVAGVAKPSVPATGRA
jgi:hypothetical protein